MEIDRQGEEFWAGWGQQQGLWLKVVLTGNLHLMQEGQAVFLYISEPTVMLTGQNPKCCALKNPLTNSYLFGSMFQTGRKL